MRNKIIPHSTLSTEMPENLLRVILSPAEEQAWLRQGSGLQMIPMSLLTTFLGMQWLLSS